MPARKRARITEDQNTDLFGRTGREAPSRRDEEEAAQRWGRPTTYRLPDELRDAIRELAESEQVPQNHLVEVALRRFLADVEEGRYTIRKEPTGYRLRTDE